MVYDPMFRYVPGFACFACNHEVSTVDGTCEKCGQLLPGAIPLNLGLTPRLIQRAIPYELLFNAELADQQRNVITVSPDVLFTPKRLVIDPVCAPYVEVGDFGFGKEIFSQGMARGTLFPPIPIDLDEEDTKRFEDLLNQPWPTLHPNTSIRFTVRKIELAPSITFLSGRFIGFTLEDL